MSIQTAATILACAIAAVTLIYGYIKLQFQRAQKALAPLDEFATDPDKYILNNPRKTSFNVKLPFDLLPPTTWILSPALVRKVLALGEETCSFNHIKRRMNHHVFGLPPEIMSDREMDATMTAIEHVFHTDLAPLRMATALETFFEHASINLDILGKKSNPLYGKLVNIHTAMYDLVSVSAIQAFFGPDFPAEAAVEHLRLVDQNLNTAFLPLLLRFPLGKLFKRSAGTPAQDAFDQLANLLQEWLARDGIQSASEMVKNAEASARQAKWAERDVARALGMFMVALTVNSSNVVAWLVLILAQMPALHIKIRQESEAAVFESGAERFSPSSLSANAPILLATIQETLRHFGFIQVIRHVHQDVVVSAPSTKETVRLKKGWQVAMPLRSMHIQTNLWGTDTLVFDPTRFMGADGKARIRDMGTFGGGSSICSGRHFAIPEIAGIVIMLLSKFDIDTEDIQILRDGSPLADVQNIAAKDLDGTGKTIRWTGRLNDGKVTQSGIMRPDGAVYMRLRQKEK